MTDDKICDNRRAVMTHFDQTPNGETLTFDHHPEQLMIAAVHIGIDIAQDPEDFGMTAMRSIKALIALGADHMQNGVFVEKLDEFFRLGAQLHRSQNEIPGLGVGILR